MTTLFVHHPIDTIPAISAWRRGYLECVQATIGHVVVLVGAVVGLGMTGFGWYLTLEHGYRFSVLGVLGAWVLWKCIRLFVSNLGVYTDQFELEFTTKSVRCSGQLHGEQFQWSELLSNYRCVLRRTGALDDVRLHNGFKRDLDRDEFYLVELKHHDDEKTICLTETIDPIQQLRDWKFYAELFRLPAREQELG